MTPIVSIVGRSGSGKTTMIEKLLRYFKSEGKKVATIKHDAHSFEVDHEGKDTWRHREAGADSVLIASDKRVFLTVNIERPRTLEELVAQFLTEDYDLILTEGWRSGGAPRIEIQRQARSSELYYDSDDKTTVAIASDKTWEGLNVPVFHIDDVEKVAKFIEEKFLTIC